MYLPIDRARCVLRFRLVLSMLFVLSGALLSQLVAQEAATEAKVAVDPSGTWKWERTFRDTPLRSTLVLKKDGDKLTGTLQTVFGDGGGPGSDPVKIDNGKIDGNQISFSVTRSFNDNEFTIEYTGKYADGKLGGTYTLDFGNGPREVEWDAQRVLTIGDLLGEWSLKFTGPNGNPIESRFTLKKDDEKLAGTYHSSFFGDNPMSKLELKGDELSWDVVFKNDNGEFTISYKAKPSGDAMKGTIKTEFGGQTNETSFEGKRDKPAKKDEGDTTGSDAPKSQE